MMPQRRVKDYKMTLGVYLKEVFKITTITHGVI
jgi:hypothetical protein